MRQHDGEQGKSMIDKPNPNTFVFCRSLANCGTIPDGDEGQTVDLQEGDMHVIRYSTVAQYVMADQVELL